MATYGNAGYGIMQNSSGGDTFSLLNQLMQSAGGATGQNTSNLYGAVDTSGLANLGSTAGGNDSLWGMLGQTNTDGTKTEGWGGLALGLAQGAFGAYNSMKTYGLAKDQLSESKRQFNANYNTQRSLLNTQMEDRQAARVASNPTAYQSVGDYMDKNGV